MYTESRTQLFNWIQPCIHVILYLLTMASSSRLPPFLWLPSYSYKYIYVPRSRVSNTAIQLDSTLYTCNFIPGDDDGLVPPAAEKYRKQCFDFLKVHTCVFNYVYLFIYMYIYIYVRIQMVWSTYGGKISQAKLQFLMVPCTYTCVFHYIHINVYLFICMYVCMVWSTYGGKIT
jgi:hypothetical protein